MVVDLLIGYWWATHGSKNGWWFSILIIRIVCFSLACLGLLLFVTSAKLKYSFNIRNIMGLGKPSIDRVSWVGLTRLTRIGCGLCISDQVDLY